MWSILSDAPDQAPRCVRRTRHRPRARDGRIALQDVANDLPDVVVPCDRTSPSHPLGPLEAKPSIRPPFHSAGRYPLAESSGATMRAPGNDLRERTSPARSRNQEYEDRRWGRGKLERIADPLWHAADGYLDLLAASTARDAGAEHRLRPIDGSA